MRPVLLALNQREELRPAGRPPAEGAPNGRGNHVAPRFLDAAHYHAQVFRLDNHGYAVRFDSLVDGIGNLGGHRIFSKVAKQKDNTSSGQLEFQYHADNLNLKSTGYDWVSVSAVQAMFEGVGTINGEGSYRFRVRAVDGDKLGTGTDRFEIRIWTGVSSYESPTYRAEGDLGGGQIVIHKK